MKPQRIGTKGLALVAVLFGGLLVAPDASAQVRSDRNAGPDDARPNTGMCGISRRTAMRSSAPRGDAAGSTAESDTRSRRGCMGMMDMTMNMDGRGNAMDMSMGPAKSQGASTRGDMGNLNIALRTQPNPARSGDNGFEVVVKDRTGQPIADADVSLAFYMPAMPSMNMPEMRKTVRLTSSGNGVYHGTGSLGMAGRWDVTVSVAQDGKTVGTKQLTVATR